MRISPRLRFVPAVLLTAVFLWAGSDRIGYQLTGKVLTSTGKPFRKIALHVFLHGASGPFAAQTVADPMGGFSFKNLQQGIYVLIAAHPQIGELRKTVEIGPSLADAKGRIEKTVLWEQSTVRRKTTMTVSSAALAVSDRARGLYRKAMDLLNRRDVDGAISRLKEALEIAPEFVAALNRLGTIAYQSRQFAQAEAYFREALDRDPASSLAISNMGGVLLAEGKITEALPFNLQAVTDEPNDPLAHSQLGRNYFFLGQNSEAEFHLREAKKLDPPTFPILS